jgi:hypothetical protein
MSGGAYLVVTYAVLWLGLLAYLGWIALRLRGVRTEVEAVRDLVEGIERADEPDVHKSEDIGK